MKFLKIIKDDLCVQIHHGHGHHGHSHHGHDHLHYDLVVIEDEHLDLHVQTLWDGIQAWDGKYFMLFVIVIIFVDCDYCFHSSIISAIKITIKFSATDVR